MTTANDDIITRAVPAERYQIGDEPYPCVIVTPISESLEQRVQLCLSKWHSDFVTRGGIDNMIRLLEKAKELAGEDKPCD